MATLYELGVKHKTDKTYISSTHNSSYLHIYERLFASLEQYEKIKILEIGVRGGNSVNMWLERFPNAEVIGIDLCECDFEVYDPERFTFYQANQTDLETLKSIAIKHKSYDIIIDDGSHIISDYIDSFYVLFPWLRRNGFYVIEDLNNNYAEWNVTRVTKANGDGSEFDNFQSFLSKYIHLGKVFDQKQAKLDVFSIHQYPGLMVVQKDLT